MAVRISAFEKDGRKYPTIGLKDEDQDKFIFTFGVSKAKLILRHMDEIRQFVEDNEKEPVEAGK